MMDKKVYTVNDLAKCLNISLPTAYTLTNQSGFPVVRVGRRVLIPADAFDRWLNEKAAQGRG